MPVEPWTRIKQIFARAVELSPAERDAYLKQSCGEDASLRLEVESLLSVSQHSRSDSESSVRTEELKSVDLELRDTAHAEGPGSVIGNYKLLQIIGEGGFGMVYLAEQQRPVVRKVAFKIIKLGMDTRQVIARFEAERQALAIMDHPNIARVLDAGATDTGRPFFVMELVKGIPISEYCDQNSLSIRERIELLVPVCLAVQHAHQKGVIHRDLKPSNVLVTSHDGKPVPKVIDFGIAKAVSQRLTEKTLFTEFRQMVGTPSYMSPEQAEFSGLDVDTRSDIYSLGVLLYELLTGVTPFDLESLRHANSFEIQRMIREVDPPRPSTRLSTLQTLASIAARRRSDVRRLPQLLRGDLDWIVMKCLEKDRTRRYETAEALARDLQHYLTHQPVTAGPPSKLYRMRKMIRRNRPAVFAGAVLVLLLSLSAIVSSWQAIRAMRAEQRADREAARQLAVNRFLVEVLSSADPMGLSATQKLRGRDITVKEVIDEAADKLDGGSMRAQPEVEAAVRAAIGQVYRSLGNYSQAARQFQAALALNEQTYRAPHANIASSLYALGQVLREQGRFNEAEPRLREALTMRRSLLAPDHPHVASTLNDLALVLKDRGNAQEAEVLLREAVEINNRIYAQEDREQATTLNNLAHVLQAQGKLSEAEPLLRQVLAMRRKLLGSEHIEIAVSLNNLAVLLQTQGKPAEAEPLLREALAMWRKQLGDEHPDVATSMRNLATMLHEQGRVAEAEPLLREALTIQRKQLPARHPDVAATLHRLGLVLAARQQYDQAEILLREALDIRREKLPAGHWSQAYTASALGAVLTAQRRFDEAEPLLLSGYEGMRDQPAAARARQRESIERIIALYEAWERPEAAANWRDALQRYDQQIENPNPGSSKSP